MKKNIYVLVMVFMRGKYVSIDPVGAYSSMDKAMDNLDECENLIPDSQQDYMMFEIINLEVNAESEFIKQFKI